MTSAFLSDHPVGPTRIKLCGLTREEDVDVAVALGVDAVGFVFYAPSPRHVTPERAARLAARVPASIASVGLFVDAGDDRIAAVLERVPLAALQFHGDRSSARCASFGLPWLRAVAVGPGFDLLEFAATHAAAHALMLDTPSPGYGGSGKVFDWSLVPPALIGPAAVRRVVLSGGLSAANVAEAIARVRPFAVDVSSGIESARGVKDPAAMRDFVAAVRSADRSRTRT